jgi:TM2 domain-containing membrane protein YozV
MRTVGIIVNIFFPGVGSIIIGKVGQGIAQIILYILGIIFSMTMVGVIIGLPLCIGVWIWGIVTAVGSPGEPIQVTVVHQNGPSTPNS